MRNIFFALLGDSTGTSLVAPWIAASFPIIRIVLFIAMAICSLIMIVTILLQSNTSNDITVVNGQESYFSENRGQSKNGRLKKITIAMAVTVLLVIILYFVTCLIYPAA